MQNLTLSLIQSDIHWQDVATNLAMFEEKISSINESTDVIILPEMFNTGFTMDTSFAEPMDGLTYHWLKKMAMQSNAVVTGSFIVNEDSKIFNRMVWMRPDGEYSTYDKRHLFRMADEHDHFDFGKTRTIVEWKGWKILLQVCYDLRFPVWSRNRNQEYDLVLYVANWPAARVSAWDALLKARAIENLSYSIGLNRVGVDGEEILYNGHSVSYAPKGNQLAFSDRVEIVHVELNAEELKSYRAKFPAHLDADDFKL